VYIVLGLAWHKASRNELQHYQTALAKYLAQIVVPVDAIVCHNVLCNEISHGTDINTYADQIIRACMLVTSEGIPATCARDSSRVPG
jgi:hypothetical protein